MSTGLAFLLVSLMNTTSSSTQRSVPVYLQKCREYNPVSLKEFFDATIPLKPNSSLQSCKIFLKPNLLSAMQKGLAATNPQFLLVLAEWLQDHGASVSIGDSPAFGKGRTVLRGLGIVEELDRRKVRIVEFDRIVMKKLLCGVEVGVAAEPLECDLFLNCAKLKAHNQMYVTLAVKNIFGIIGGMRKSWLHMRHGGDDNMFSRIILDLIHLLPPHFSLMDGIIAMNREGPIHGSPLTLGLLAASSDPVALDTALLYTLQLDREKSPLWLEAKRRELMGAELTAIEYPLAQPQLFFGSGFEAPQELSPIRFNPLRFIYGNIKRLGLKIRKK